MPPPRQVDVLRSSPRDTHPGYAADIAAWAQFSDASSPEGDANSRALPFQASFVHAAGPSGVHFDNLLDCCADCFLIASSIAASAQSETARCRLDKVSNTDRVVPIAACCACNRSAGPALIDGDDRVA
jgi:hypothetical protein